ncbi:hypothetical protein [Negadavirga shengliensis]|uniref:Uncharacterized protein n=1 Tax=Negadavirga shengliensis TaxID=1389218 RepID=A0ABV9T6U5_9BACT
MAKKKSAFDEIEKMLQDIGSKIEILIEKGAQATGEARDEIEEKIQELKKNKEKLEKDLKEKKKQFENKYKGRRKDVEPKLQESLQHFKEGFSALIAAINNLFK